MIDITMMPPSNIESMDATFESLREYVSDKKIQALFATSVEMMQSISSFDRQQALSTAVFHVHSILESEACAIFLVSEDNPRTLTLVASYTDVWQHKFEPVNLRIGKSKQCGLTSYMASSGETLRLHGPKLRDHPYVAGKVPNHLYSKQCISLLGVPLKDRKGRVLGILKVENKKGTDNKPTDTISFDVADELIAKILANEIVILHEYLRTAEMLQCLVKSVNSASNIQNVLDTILKKGIKLMNANRGAIALLDDSNKRLLLGSQIGKSSLKLGAPVPLKSIMNTVFSSREPIIIGDISKHPDYHCCDQRTKSELTVPLEWENHCFGVINVESFQQDFFDKKDLALLQHLAQYAIIAYRIVDKEIRFHGIIARLGDDPLSREDILNNILDSVRAIGRFEAGIIYTVDATRKELRCSAYRDDHPQNIEWKDFRYRFDQHSLAVLAFNEQRAYYINNPANSRLVNQKGRKAFRITNSLLAIPLIYEFKSSSDPSERNLPQECLQKKVVGVLVVWSRKQLDHNGKYYVSHLEPFAHLAATYMALSEVSQVRRQILATLTRTLTLMQKEFSLNEHLRLILQGAQFGGFDRARIYQYNEETQSYLCADSLGAGTEKPGVYKGFAISLRSRSYARLARIQARQGNLHAQIADPTYKPGTFRPDPDAARLGKPDDLPWAFVPLMVADTFFGQITVDNATSRRIITTDSLEYLTLLGALASIVLAIDRGGRAEGFAKAFQNLAWSLTHEIANAAATLTLMLDNAQAYQDQDKLEHAKDLIRAMREASYSQIESAYMYQQETGVYTLYDIAERALISMKVLMRLHDVQYKIEGDQQIQAIVNPIGMLVAFISVIRNAIEAMRDTEDRRILTISIHRIGSHIEVSFEDTGRGLSPAAQDKRLEEEGFSSHKKRKGTGLWIVKQIMDDCQGTLSYHNVPNSGARFTLSYPCVND